MLFDLLECLSCNSNLLYFSGVANLRAIPWNLSLWHRFSRILYKSRNFHALRHKVKPLQILVPHLIALKVPTENSGTEKNMNSGFPFSPINFPPRDSLITLFIRSLHTEAFGSNQVPWEGHHCSHGAGMSAGVHSSSLHVPENHGGSHGHLKGTERLQYKPWYLSQRFPRFSEFPYRGFKPLHKYTNTQKV